MAPHHHHHPSPESGDRRMGLAIAVNLLLTLAQIIGGVLAGSLSLIADALHNFSDAVSLLIAFGARRIARRPADRTMTFGYGRVEIVAALINYTTLIIIGLFLIYEAVLRFIAPQPVEGWLIVIIAGIALIVDTVTALLTYSMSKSSMNIRAAFLHNMADALGSIGVIIAGTLILLYDWQLIDPIATLMIAGYILWQAFSEIGGTIRILMLGTPPDLDLDGLVEAMRQTDGVEGVHHLRVWAIDERETALNAHVVTKVIDGEVREAIKTTLKRLLGEDFGVRQSTLQFELPGRCDGESARVIGLSESPKHG